MNTKLTMVLRIVLGLVLVIFGANKFYPFMPQPEEMSIAAASFMQALKATGYMFPLIGAVEVFSGLLLLFKKSVPLALLLLAPVTVNILLFHIALEPATLVPGLVILIIQIILFYAYWDKFKTLFN
ncbi:DoxX family membrane protein [Aureibaculum marinum]|uniref:DoxX family membrane protein n=1 Tax=Aureibaculum marinum TaxID=2487930 RepID=A0A3N4NY02_9FLAO|nr:DoxX family membrane protein [Aureibaculum marinum]RPD99667.1 DoxX family membrane protein [Aureibaculum marinum]